MITQRTLDASECHLHTTMQGTLHTFMSVIYIHRCNASSVQLLEIKLATMYPSAFKALHTSVQGKYSDCVQRSLELHKLKGRRKLLALTVVAIAPPNVHRQLHGIAAHACMHCTLACEVQGICCDVLLHHLIHACKYSHVRTNVYQNLQCHNSCHFPVAVHISHVLYFRP